MYLFFRKLSTIGKFYQEGFKNMTWGRPLWTLIFLKLFILFALLRTFFFQPAMSGMTDTEKSERVGIHLTQEIQKKSDTILTK